MFFEVAGLPGGGFFLGEKYSKPPPPMEPMEKTLKYIFRIQEGRKKYNIRGHAKLRLPVVLAPYISPVFREPLFLTETQGKLKEWVLWYKQYSATSYRNSPTGNV